jgi:hypothetical protein
MTPPFAPTLGALVRALMCAALIPTAAWASPGAHGPNGEHLDAPAAVVGASAAPKLSAHSDVLELVARLQGDALVIDLGRFDTNEPIAKARVEVELGALRAQAQWRPTEGDYLLGDAAMLKALQAEGEHALVFTIEAGETSDLLEGVLHNEPDHDDPAHDADEAPTPGAMPALGAGPMGASAVVLALAGGVVWWRRRQRAALPAALKEVV